MANQDAHPINFRFDEAKSFSENCEAFLSRLDKIDAGLTTILRDNWDALVAIVREGERNSRARGEFNSAVASALDSLVNPAEPKDGA
jgi:hypothetical protein